MKWEWVSNKWKKRGQLTPSVALAVTNTVSNLALAIAIGQGVAIAWWRKVLAISNSHVPVANIILVRLSKVPLLRIYTNPGVSAHLLLIY
jgi:hypothetical protein